MTIREEGYAEGYRDGYFKRDEEIVRCKDCIFHEKSIKGKGYCCGTCDGLGSVDDDWFCADGERKDGDKE